MSASIIKTIIPCVALMSAAAALPQVSNAAPDADEASAATEYLNVSSLQGKQVDYDSYKDYVTTGRPRDNRRKIFLLYNVGAKKFLNIGSYWGSHAALSEIPRPFWLQRRNEKKVGGQWSYMRYPETADEKEGYFYNDFFASAAMQIGSQEGDNAPHVTYNYIRLVDNATGNTLKNVVDDGTNVDGSRFIQTLEGVDFTTMHLEAQIDMSECKGTSSKAMETLLSFGSDISTWKSGVSGVSNLHVYGYRANGQSHIVVQPTDQHFSDAAYSSGDSRNPISVGADNLVTIDIRLNSVLVNGVECMPRSGNAESAVQPFINNITVFRAGSQEGKVRSNATYDYVRLTSVPPSTDGSGTNVLPPACVGNGTRFVKTFSGALGTTREVNAIISLSSCGRGGRENILSVGTDISQRGETAQNIHMYYDGTTFTVEGVNPTHTGSSSLPVISATPAVSATVAVKLNAAGLFIDGKLVEGFGPDNEILDYLVNSAAQFQVGSEVGEGELPEGRSFAIYNSLTVDKITDDTQVVEPGYQADGTSFYKKYAGNLSDKLIEADISLASCTGNSENILSIGNDIEKWGFGENYNIAEATNIHFYYTRGNKNATYQFVSKPCGIQSQAFTVDVSDGTLHLTLDRGRLTINGTAVDDVNGVLSYLTNTATSIMVGSAEGSNRSHAVYNKLSVNSVAAETSDASKRHAMRAAAADGSYTTDLVEPGTAAGGMAFASEASSINFASGDRIEAQIDLSGCVSRSENILSIGTDINEWGNKANMHNIHFYYMGKVSMDGVQMNEIQVVYVNANHSEDNKRSITIPVGEKLLILLDKDGLTVNGTDIYPDVEPMPNIGFVNGHEGDIVRFKQDANGNFILNAAGKYIPVLPGDEGYDTAHGIYTSNSGYLYTTENRSQKEMPLFISSRFSKESTTGGNEDVFLAWAPFLPNSNAYGNVGVYADRALPSSEITTAESLENSQWIFEPATAQDPAERQHNTYRIYLSMTDARVAAKNGNKPSADDRGYDITVNQGIKKYYLQASSDYVYGNNLENYNGTWDVVNTGVYTQAEALANDDKTDYSVWKVIDITEYYRLFGAANSEMTSMFDLTYMLSDPSFSRNSLELSTWKTDTALDGFIRFGIDHYSKKTVADTDYTDESGKKTQRDSNGNVVVQASEQYDIVAQRIRNHARFMGADVRRGGSGRIYQDVEITYPGWYAVTVGGMSNAGAKLFVQYVKDGAESAPVEQQIPALSEAMREQFNGTRQGWPYDQVKTGADDSYAMPMYNALVAINDDALEGGQLVRQYTTQVAFFVDPDVMAENGGSVTLRFGLDIPSAEAVQSIVADAVQAGGTTVQTVAEEDRWTVFDNFHLLFGGLSKEPHLILDEDNTSLDYLDNTVHLYDARPMRLRRTFKGGEWNTLMLPLNLTLSDFTSMFGSTARLAKLSKLTATSVDFEECKAEENGIFLNAYKPYLIYVDADHAQGKGRDGDGQPYTAELGNRSDGAQTYTTVTVDANHFYLDAATLQGKHKGSDGQYSYTFAADTRQAQTIEFDSSTANASGTLYTYRDSHLAEGNGEALRAYGTLCKNFQTVNGKNTIPDGYPTLQGAYVMDGSSNMRYIKTAYGTKGFRCWFVPETATGTVQALSVTINGVADGTTSVADINRQNGDAIGGRFANGVFSLDGRMLRGENSLEGLPAGIYIMQGTKVAVE